MPQPISFEWRIESRAPNGTIKFAPLGDDRNYLKTEDKYVEAITALKLTGFGDCLEASFQALKAYLPNNHLSSADVIGASIRYSSTENWSDVYAGIVSSPGAPNSYELSTISLLGLRKRLYETVVPAKFGTLVNFNPWSVDIGIDGRSGDIGQVIWSLIASVADQLGGIGATLSKNLGGIATVTGYNVTVDPNFNSCGELIDKILELIPAINGQKAIWGVNGKREVFVVRPTDPRATLEISALNPGTSVEWNTVDSSKVISAVQWVGFTTSQTLYGKDGQNFVSYQSQGDQSFGFSAIRENVPESMITGVTAPIDLDGLRYNRPNTGGDGLAINNVALPYTATSYYLGASFFATSAFNNATGFFYRVDGIRINCAFVRKQDTQCELRILRMDNGGATFVESIDLLEGDHDYWFSDHNINGSSTSYATRAAVFLFDYNVQNFIFKTFEFLALDTTLLDRIAESRYRFPAPDAATITVEGVILTPKPLVRITWKAIDGTVKSVTRSAETFEYNISAGGYPTTIIRAGQARDANESAIWAEIKGRDKRATNNALSYAPRSR
jgi:hypothetical protein